MFKGRMMASGMLKAFNEVLSNAFLASKNCRGFYLLASVESWLVALS